MKRKKTFAVYRRRFVGRAVFFLLAALSLPLFAKGNRDLGEKAVQPVLSVGIMPDVNSLPIMVAHDEGFFIREEVNVELVNFSNAQERDAAIQAGRIDGVSSDILAAALFSAGGFDMKVTSLTDGRYGIAGSPSTKKIEDLKGKKIGLSANTIIQYAVEAQLEAAGIAADAYEPVAVPRMPLRLEMLLLGRIDAAGLPEPLLSAAVEQGGNLLSTTDGLGISGVMLFSKKSLDSRLDDIKRFYRAYDKASQKINADSDSYRGYLVEKAAFPEQVKNAYRFVHYGRPALPEIHQVEKVLAWLKDRGLVNSALNARDLLDGRAVSE